MNNESNTSLFSNARQREMYKADALDRVSKYNHPLSVTLTFIGNEKKVRHHAEGRFNTLRHKMSKKVNRNRYRRHKELIECVATQEYDREVRPHVHAVFDVPANMRQEDFLNIMTAYCGELLDLRTDAVRRDDLRKGIRKTPLIKVSEWTTAEQAVDYLMKEESKDRSMNFAEFVIA